MTDATVSLVDPDTSLRESLLDFLESVSLPAVGYDSIEAFLAAWNPEQPGCLVTELYPGGMSGIELQEDLHERGLWLPIIFVSDHADVETAVRAVQNGAVGFLNKPFSRQVLLENLRAALIQDREEREARAQREQARTRLESLSPRERQLFDSVVRGLRNREIAEELQLSLKTVEMHRSRMMRKLEADTIIDLVDLQRAAYD